MEICFKRVLKIIIKNFKNLTFRIFLLSIFILSALQNLCLGRDVLPVLPLEAATDNAARYMVTSSPVPSTERNIYLDFGDVFNDFASRTARKIQLY